MSHLEELEYVWEGKYFTDNNHLEALRGEFLKKLESLHSIESDIDACKNEFQRIQAINKLFKWIPVPQCYYERFKKSAGMSLMLREKANAAYKGGQYHSALRGYSLAIMFATLDGEELGLAYGNRSALFVQMKEQNLALFDIEKALTSKCSDHLKEKLLERQKKCNEIIRRKNEDINAQLKLQQKQNCKKYCNDNIMRLKSPHASITNAEKFVTIDFTEKHGRRLIVNRSVPAGTVLVIEEPYVHVLDKFLTWDTKHCHFCSKKILAGIPCTSCTFVIYCSDRCRRKAVENGHLFEHNLLSYHHSHETGLTDLISSRIIVKAGPELLFNLFQRSKRVNGQQGRDSSGVQCGDVYFKPDKGTVHGHNEEGVFESGSYLPIYHLISHTLSKPLKDVVSNIFRVLVLTNLLREASNFFSLLESRYSEEFPQEQFEEFVASLLLRHIENIPYNAVSVNELKSNSEDLDTSHPLTSSLDLKKYKSMPYATAIFCLISLANHSCDPNTVIAKKSEFQETALVTIRSLHAGDEVFITYKPQFTSQDTQLRRKFLLERYNFVCQCTACVSDWSVKSHLVYKVPFTKCPECQQNRVCQTCDNARALFSLQSDAYQSKLYEADDLLQSGDFIQAFSMLKECLQFFTTHFSTVFSLCQVAQDLFKRGLLFMLYSYD